MWLDSEHHFSYRMATVVASGYALSVAGATYVDGHITTHVRYPHPRVYIYGYWILLLAMPLFLITAIGIRMARTRGWKCAAACLPLVTIVAVSEWVFEPEVPHQGVTNSCALYGIAVL